MPIVDFMGLGEKSSFEELTGLLLVVSCCSTASQSELGSDDKRLYDSAGGLWIFLSGPSLQSADLHCFSKFEIRHKFQGKCGDPHFIFDTETM